MLNIFGLCDTEYEHVIYLFSPDVSTLPLWANLSIEMSASFLNVEQLHICVRLRVRFFFFFSPPLVRARATESALVSRVSSLDGPSYIRVDSVRVP